MPIQHIPVRCLYRLFSYNLFVQSFDKSSNRVFRKSSTASEKSMPLLSERTASHQTHPSILDGRMA